MLVKNKMNRNVSTKATNSNTADNVQQKWTTPTIKIKLIIIMITLMFFYTFTKEA